MKELPQFTSDSSTRTRPMEKEDRFSPTRISTRASGRTILCTVLVSTLNLMEQSTLATLKATRNLVMLLRYVQMAQSTQECS